MNGFSIPNHTQTPNALFDELMRDMSEAELKVTLAVIRKTLGYHKQQDPISWSQIMKMTGLSRGATQTGIDLALERGLIEIVGHGLRGVNVFGLVLILDQSEIKTSTGIKNRPELVQNSDTQKKGIKENKKEKSAAPIHPLIQTWATIRGIDAENIGAPIYTAKDTASAKRMAKWTVPPTNEEILLAINSSKSKSYAFKWLEDDITQLRLAGVKPPPQVAPPPPPQEAEPPRVLSPEETNAREAEYKRWMELLLTSKVEKTVEAA